MIEWSPEALQVLGLRHWQRRQGGAVIEQASGQEKKSAPPPPQAVMLPPAEQDLLEKILLAIGESAAQCEVRMVSSSHVSVRLPDGWRLEFDTLGPSHDNRCVLLAGLSAMLANPALKKPVWKQLKQWNLQRKNHA